MPSDLIAQHQEKFDRQFPHGAAVAWQDAAGKTAYLIPRIMVTGQRGLDPEIWLPVFAGSNKTLGPFRVLSREDLPSAGPPIIRLTLDGEERPLLLNGGVPAAVAEAMAADRQQFMDLAPHGGPRVFDGDAPE